MRSEPAKGVEEYIDEIKKDNMSTARTVEMLTAFDNSLRLERRKESTRSAYLWSIKYLYSWTKKPLEDTTKQDIDGYILSMTESCKPRTVEMRKVALKRFFQTNGMNHLVENLKFIRVPKDKRKKPILTRSELAGILSHTEHIRDHALVMFMYESGCRVSEALAVDIGDLNFDQHGLVFEVKETMKTGARRIRLVESVPIIKEYLAWHPLRSKKEAPLWVKYGRNKRARLKPSGVKMVLKGLEKRSGTDVKLHAHLFRRSRATELAQVLSNQQLRRMFGWSSDSMIQVYAQPDDEALDNRMLEINGIQNAKKRITTRMLTKKCPSCYEMVTEGAAFCPKCGQGLTKEQIEDYHKNNFPIYFLEGIQEIAKANPLIERSIREASKQYKRKQQSL